MDYSAANHTLWNIIIQLGLIAGSILLANFLRQKLRFVRQSLMPVAVLAGFLLLILKYTGVITPDNEIMEILVYHGIALGFIAMSLRVPSARDGSTGDRAGLKSGAIIVSTYLIQGVTGLVITLALSYTLMPGLFKAAGLLLPMGYGQGPGQANNVGSTYESLGFVGGRSFGLSIAAAGYLVACVVGVIILNILSRRRRIPEPGKRAQAHIDGDFFQSEGEIPISDSIDKFSVQLAMIIVVYLATYLVSRGITAGLSAVAPGLAATVNTLIWGFNFILGSALAILLRVLLEKGKKAGILQRQYQNNYLLNRSSGVLLLREIDPDLATPAANNLITGSSFGIVLGAPVLLLVGLAPRSDLLCWVTLGIMAAYMGLLVLLILRLSRRHKA